MPRPGHVQAGAGQSDAPASAARAAKAGKNGVPQAGATGLERLVERPVFEHRSSDDGLIQTLMLAHELGQAARTTTLRPCKQGGLVVIEATHPTLLLNRQRGTSANVRCHFVARIGDN
jgi:hypothetical protein